MSQARIVDKHAIRHWSKNLNRDVSSEVFTSYRTSTRVVIVTHNNGKPIEIYLHEDNVEWSSK